MINTFKHQAKQVVFVGDIHGDFFHLRTIASNYDNALIFQVGDFGAGYCSRSDFYSCMRKLAVAAALHNNKVVAIRGNHDDPQFFAGETLFDTVTLLPDNCIVEAADHRMFCTGGATSIDRSANIEGISWWRDEKVNVDFDIIDQARDIDIVVTHTAPEGFSPAQFVNPMVEGWIKRDPALRVELIAERKILRDAYQRLIGNNAIKHWVYGHFHHTCVEYVNGCAQRCIDINCVWSPDYTPINTLVSSDEL